MTSPRSIWLMVSCLAAGALISACGVYSFNPRGESNISSIAVETFQNETDQYGLADQVTVTVIDAFIADGSIKVVSADVAEALLVGTLTSYRREAHEFDEADQVSRYNVQVGFDVTLMDPSDQSEIWAIQLTIDGFYDAGSETEEDGQADVSRQLVEAVLNKTTKSW